MDLNDLTAAIFVIDACSGRVVKLNSEAEEVTGFEAEELKDKPFSELFLNEDRHRIESLIEDFSESKKAYEYDLVLRKRSGKKVIFDLGFRDIIVAENKYVIFTLHDITELKKAEKQKIAGAKDDMLAILGSMLEALIVFGPDGRISMANNSALRLIGYESTEVLERPIQDFFKEDIFPRNRIRSILEGKKVENEETFLVNKNGREIPLLFSASSLTISDKRKSDHVLLVGTDISEKLKAEEILEEQNVAMAHSSRLSELGEMASGIAHEINNPLTVINGRMSLLKYMINNVEQVEKEKLVSSVETVHSMFKRIENIVKSLRTFSRDSSEDPFEIASIDEIIKDTLILCEKKIETFGIELNLDLLDASEEIFCRPSEISQVLLNLINNAIDAVEDSSEPWITVRAKKSNQWAEISVIDSGEGIPEEAKQKIVQPFYTTKPVGKGTGLGLSISKTIIERHHGVFKIGEEENHTCFTLRLPLRSVMEKDPGFQAELDRTDPNRKIKKSAA